MAEELAQDTREGVSEHRAQKGGKSAEAAFCPEVEVGEAGAVGRGRGIDSLIGWMDSGSAARRLTPYKHCLLSPGSRDHVFLQREEGLQALGLERTGRVLGELEHAQPGDRLPWEPRPLAQLRGAASSQAAGRLPSPAPRISYLGVSANVKRVSKHLWRTMQLTQMMPKKKEFNPISYGNVCAVNFRCKVTGADSLLSQGIIFTFAAMGSSDVERGQDWVGKKGCRQAGRQRVLMPRQS